MNFPCSPGKPIICKGAVCRRGGEALVMEEVEVAPPSAWEVRIKVLCTSLCHTDLSFWSISNGPFYASPRIFGHEAVGVVESVGEHVEEVRAGDIVVPVFLPNCGECRDCKSKRSNICSKFPQKNYNAMPRDPNGRFKDMNGDAIHHFLFVSSFVEYTVVDIAHIVKISSQMPFDKACLLSCGVATGVGATWKVAEVEQGSSVAIFGLGTVGLAVAEGARRNGASKIIGVDLNPDKLELGKKFGITDFVNPEMCKDKTTSQVIKEMTDGGADYCFECIGLASLMKEAFDSTREGWGRTIILGVELKGNPLSLDCVEVMKGRSVMGSLFGGIKPKVDIPLLVHKYLHQSTRARSSTIWRGIRWGLDEMLPNGLAWNVGNGHNIRFWEDRWVGNKPLSQIALSPVSESDKARKVKDYWDAERGWNWEEIADALPPSTLLSIAGLAVCDEPGMEDSLCWAAAPSGSYTVASAYYLLRMPTAPTLGDDLRPLFKLIWRLNVPERVRCFLWLVLKGKILSNVERYRRRMTDSARCEVCGLGDESLIHLFRDCQGAADMWQHLVCPDQMAEFFAANPFNWLQNCLRGNFQMGRNLNGAVVFAVAAWWSWRWRNTKIFRGKDPPQSRHAFVIEQVRDYQLAALRITRALQRAEKQERMISWDRPSLGWWKVNTDGSVKGPMGHASAGGVLRDENGGWKAGFVCNLGVCSVPRAEFWGIIHGLALAWEKGCRRVQVEVDSQLVLTLLRSSLTPTHPFYSLAMKCQSFLRRDWLVRFRHIFREANKVADHLASLAHGFPLGTHILEEPPVGAQDLLSRDVMGVSTPRLVTS